MPVSGLDFQRKWQPYGAAHLGHKNCRNLMPKGNWGCLLGAAFCPRKIFLGNEECWGATQFNSLLMSPEWWAGPSRNKLAWLLVTSRLQWKILCRRYSWCSAGASVTHTRTNTPDIIRSLPGVSCLAQPGCPVPKDWCSYQRYEGFPVLRKLQQSSYLRTGNHSAFTQPTPGRCFTVPPLSSQPISYTHPTPEPQIHQFWLPY